MQGAWYCTAVQGTSPVWAVPLRRHTDSLPHQAQSGLWLRHSEQLWYWSQVGREGHCRGEPCRMTSLGVGSASWHTREAREKPQPADKQGAQPDMESQ